jgi:hypothetical protein
MASSALGIQVSTIDEYQTNAITNESEDEENDNTNSVTAQLDISSIILQVLGSFNNAKLGSTEISGGLVADDIIVDELIFSSDGKVIDISDIRHDISNLKTNVSYFSNIISEISGNLFTLDNSSVKLDTFNDLSFNYYNSL